ncbi:MAG TPA: S8 family serine peptidase [Candidatus Polarisedimenticolia bacterium]|nr:S8 family serine peptidase [Candidatus Polarisedimenticolia bacterium]
MCRTRSRRALVVVAIVLLTIPILPAGPYVTETSGIRWNDVGGLRWNDVGGIRWNDVGGLRWNDVGGIRWNDVGGLLWSDATGLRWNDVGGLRWNDVGGLVFEGPPPQGLAAIDPQLLVLFSTLPDSSSINVIVTYHAAPTASDLAALTALGIPGGTRFRRLPMLVVNASKDQIRAIAMLPAVRSVFADRTLAIFDGDSAGLIGLPDVAADPALRAPGGAALTGAGVTIAVIDTGVDGTHPDLPYGTKLVGNVRLAASAGTGPGFLYPVPTEGVVNTDLVLGHGTAVASVAAGTGVASAGAYRGIAPGASVLGLSAGDLFIFNVLEGFDYALDNRARYGVRVVNCSWGAEGFFDPDDPVNIATRQLFDEGIVVVFAAGNHGPSPDTLNPYAAAPWVIGVGSVGRDGRLSPFSSRGIFEELLYHPVLVAPGEGIVAAKPVALGGVGGTVGVADPDGGASVPPQFALHYAAVSGTSFAAPHVAGVVALMLEAAPALTPTGIKRILQATATPLVARDRSEAGAGRLEAWAALTQAIDAARPFGSFVPGWTDARAYRIEHRAPIVSQAIVPGGGSLAVPVDLNEAVASWGLTLAWGSPGIGDLDLTVVDENGTVLARSESFNGAGIFGRTEGAALSGAVPRALTAQISFKANAVGPDQPIEIRQETAVAVLTGFSDLDSLDPSSRDLLARAVSRHVIEGRGARFEPKRSLERGELARSLALTAGLPQRIPAAPSFPDVGASDPSYPFVETAAGDRAAAVLIDPKPNGQFASGQPIDRLAFAVSMVRAAGLAGEADARAGETIGLCDDLSVPLPWRGYAAVALERGLIDTVTSKSGICFAPSGTVPRLNAARFLLRLLGLREGGLAFAPAGTVRSVLGSPIRTGKYPH